MNEAQIKRSRGQVLVLVVLMLVGLIAMLALVLDGGSFYSQRRQAQLAADAGALAGARARCDPDVEQTPFDAANTYVINNEAVISDFQLGPGEMEVTVETSIPFDTFFLGVLGRPVLTATAVAAARCETGSGARVLPIAWSCKPPNITDTVPTGEFTSTCELDIGEKACDYPQPIDSTDPEDWDKFYIVIDSDDLGDTMYCAEEYHGYDPEEEGGWGYGFTCADCDSLVAGTPFYNERYEYCHSEYPRCDINCDGTTDVEIMSESSFGWLDLDGDGSDANELSQWVLGNDDPTVEVHWWYAGKSGVAASVFDTVGDELEAGRLENVVVPVFNHFCHGLPSADNNECTWHPRDNSEDESGEDEVMESGGTFDDYFHIIGFANFQVKCIDSGPYKNCPFHEILGLQPNVKTIEGCFLQGVDPDITGYGSMDFEAYTLRLSR